MDIKTGRSGSTIILENADGHIAMQLRDDTFKWGLFGGWSKPDENPDETILREIDEELGIALNPDRLTFLHTFKFPLIGIANVFHYTVQNELDHAVLTEGITFRFLTWSEIKKKSVPSNHQQILTWYRSQHLERQ
ncbi:MAG: NUDIX domain-containing protein [Candidatus Latescibacteria bacterium]|nr:NUDIX domain-containing protein [Candidatus Latescibacterota bacterium]